MNDSTKTSLLFLRIVVGILGEKAHYGWWPTSFFEPTSALFLEPSFAKTRNLTQYHGVLEAARRLHDEHLNVGSYHLFRLPEELEHSLHDMAQTVLPSILPNPIEKQTYLASLKQRCLSSVKSFEEGPVAVGKIEDVYLDSVCESIAGAYLWSFEQGKKTYPYLAR